MDKNEKPELPSKRIQFRPIIDVMDWLSPLEQAILFAKLTEDRWNRVSEQDKEQDKED